MELACVMAQYKFDATLVFMTVAAEEQGLYGAADFAEKAKQKKWHIAGMLNNDIIGSSMNDEGKCCGFDFHLGVFPVEGNGKSC